MHPFLYRVPSSVWDRKRTRYRAFEFSSFKRYIFSVDLRKIYDCYLAAASLVKNPRVTPRWFGCASRKIITTFSGTGNPTHLCIEIVGIVNLRRAFVIKEGVNKCKKIFPMLSAGGLDVSKNASLHRIFEPVVHNNNKHIHIYIEHPTVNCHATLRDSPTTACSSWDGDLEFK